MQAGFIKIPKAGEVQRWMLWVMALAIIGLGSTIVALHHEHKIEVNQLRTELTTCQNERTKSEQAFRQELRTMYKEVLEYREEAKKAILKRRR